MNGKNLFIRTKMQYIKKQNLPPADWNEWFTKAAGGRSFDYGSDYGSLTNLSLARQFLIDEQNGLCAYCQQSIKIDNSSIEHVIPKEFNIELSTNYYNLVAVCRHPSKDPDTDKLHCDKGKGSNLITPLIFISSSDVTDQKSNCFFDALADGQITAKHTLSQEHIKQVESFISILNLNHKILKEKRAKDVIDGLIAAFGSIQNHQKNDFWQIQFDRILLNKKHPFRQFLLIFIGRKLGLS